MKNKNLFLLFSYLVFLPLKIHSTPQNVSDWTEAFNCKGGLVITHKPDGISWHGPKETQSARPPKETLELWMNPATHSPLKTPLSLKIQLSHDDFRTALLKAGLMDSVTPDSAVTGSTPAQQ